MLGWEDINDHDQLRTNGVEALALDSDDLKGKQRRRERDRGHPLAGSSTLNRVDSGDPKEAQDAGMTPGTANGESW